MTPEKLQAIVEAALMVSGQPLTIPQLAKLFNEKEQPENADIKAALEAIGEKYGEESGIELKQVARGYRLQAKAELSPWLSKLWADRAPRYSRAFLETLAIIAYKQPVTRAEIEAIRGVTVSSHIIKTLIEREWIRVVGHKEVPGRPAILGTTKHFLDYFNLKSLSEMPTLAELKNIEKQDTQVQVALAMEESDIGPSDAEVIPEERDATIAEDETINEEPLEEAVTTLLEEINTHNEENNETKETKETETHTEAEQPETEAVTS